MPEWPYNTHLSVYSAQYTFSFFFSNFFCMYKRTLVDTNELLTNEPRDKMPNDGLLTRLYFGFWLGVFCVLVWVCYRNCSFWQKCKNSCHYLVLQLATIAIILFKLHKKKFLLKRIIKSLFIGTQCIST